MSNRGVNPYPNLSPAPIWLSPISGNTNIGLTLNLKFPVLMVSADSATPKSCALAAAGASTATTAAIKASRRKSTLPSFAGVGPQRDQGAMIVPGGTGRGKKGSLKSEVRSQKYHFRLHFRLQTSDFRLQTSYFLLLKRHSLHAPVRHLADEEVGFVAAVDRVRDAELLRQLAGFAELADHFAV